jgi:hypothetical protein
VVGSAMLIAGALTMLFTDATNVCAEPVDA